MIRKRLLVLATYPFAGAATRYRLVSYFASLNARGIEADLVSFYDDEEFGSLYSGGLLSNARSTLRGAGRLLTASLMSFSYDAVLVQRAAAPLGGPWLERFTQHAAKLPLIFDFDDAIWLDTHANSRYPRLARFLRPEKATELMRQATHVIAGSRVLAEKARTLNSTVTVLPTSVPAGQWRPARPFGHLQGEMPVVGWVGTHSTAPQLAIALRALEYLAAEGHRFRVRIVGAADRLPQTSLAVERKAWRLEEEVQDFQSLDIGLGPLHADEWSAGKCGFKQIQYMATGVPMVSSPVGGALELLRPEADALFASSPDDWVRQLRRLLLDQNLRAALAQAAHQRFETEYSLEVQATTFVNIVEATIRGGQREREVRAWRR